LSHVGPVPTSRLCPCALLCYPLALWVRVGSKRTHSMATEHTKRARLQERGGAEGERDGEGVFL
jgi:hypothetical protein